MGADALRSAADGHYEGMFPPAPMREEDVPNAELLEAWEYNNTPRAQYRTAPGYMTARSLDEIVTYDAYNEAEALFFQPLLTAVGSEADSCIG